MFGPFSMRSSKYHEQEEKKHDAEQSEVPPRFITYMESGKPPTFTLQDLKRMIEERVVPDGRRGRASSGPGAYEFVHSPRKHCTLAEVGVSSTITYAHFAKRADEIVKYAAIQSIAESLYYAKASSKGNDYVRVMPTLYVITHAFDGYGDQHPHKHIGVLKAAVDDHGKVRSVAKVCMHQVNQFMSVYIEKGLDDMYQAAGFKTERVGGKVSIIGIPEPVVKQMSPGSRAIDAYLKKHGIASTPKSRKLAATIVKPLPQKFYRIQCEERMRLALNCLGVTPEHLLHKKQQYSLGARSQVAADVVRESLQTLGTRKTFFTRTDLLITAVKQSIGTPAQLKDIIRDVNARLERHKNFGLIKVNDREYVLKSQIQKAKEIINEVNAKIKPETAKEAEKAKEAKKEKAEGKATKKEKKQEKRMGARVKVTREKKEKKSRVSVKQPTVSVTNSSVELFLQQTSKAGRLKRHYAAFKRAAFEARGSINERLHLAELRYKEAGKVEKPIRKGDHITVEHAGSALIQDLQLMAIRAEKAGARIELKDKKKELERIRDVLDQHQNLSKSITYTITR